MSKNHQNCRNFCKKMNFKNQIGGRKLHLAEPKFVLKIRSVLQNDRAKFYDISKFGDKNKLENISPGKGPLGGGDFVFFCTMSLGADK